MVFFPSTMKSVRMDGVTNKVFDYETFEKLRRSGQGRAKVPMWEDFAFVKDVSPRNSVIAPGRVSKKFSRPNAPPAIKTNLSPNIPRPPLGAQKAGWGKPVPLLGLTKEQAAKVKSTMVSKGITKNTVQKMSSFRNKTVQSSAVPGRYFSNQAAWIAAAVAQQELQQYRLDPYNPVWGVVDQVGSIVSTGLSYVNPILGAIAGPAVEGIAQLASQAAKNNAFEGTMGLGSNENIADFKRYAKFLEDNPDIVITQDEWKAYDDQLQAYEGKGSSCKKFTITPEMLGDQTLEEYMAENGIKPVGPPPEKPKSRGSTRAPTKEEEDAVKDIRLQ